jgi:hypothetical protein
MPRRNACAIGALAVTALLAVTACGDDDEPTTNPTTTTVAPDATTSTSTTTAPSDEDAVRSVVQTFAEEQVGMVDPVVEPITIRESSPRQASAEVRTRREGGGADPSLTPTVVELVEDGGTWRIESASSEHLAFDSPPPGQRLSAGFVTPSGTATAFEGTVVVQALLGTEVIDEVVTTAEGIEDAAWAARLELGSARGAGHLLAFTTAGTELGPPVFALVPVLYGES